MRLLALARVPFPCIAACELWYPLGSPHLSSYLPYGLSCAAYCPMSEHQLYPSCLRWKGKSSFCYSIMARRISSGFKGIFLLFPCTTYLWLALYTTINFQQVGTGLNHFKIKHDKYKWTYSDLHVYVCI